MKNIFVGNLDFGATEESVRELFANYGRVERVHLEVDRDTGRPRGFAFVEMVSEADADRAIAQLNGVQLKGNALTVNEGSGSTASGSLPAARAQRTKGQDVTPHQSRPRRGLRSKSPALVAANETSSHEQPPSHAKVHVTTTEPRTVDLDGIVTITARAIEIFGTREKAIRWLRTPLPSLSDRTPLSMMNTADGIEHLEDVLGRIEQGVW
ncbi:MAG: antitoxin Xre/MbcA/ParS toxin-binding domain-containing protein [Bryobacteraceae bacterium]|jgi:RNA recognition motif-containing protein